MPRTLKWIIIAAVVLVVPFAGAAVALWYANDRDAGALDTELDDVTVTQPKKPRRLPPTPKAPESDKECWLTFGGDSSRSLARPFADLGLPKKKPLWSRGLKTYIEFPGTYCEGTLYVNTTRGSTYALESETGDIRWRRRVGGQLPSSPAISGPRLFVGSQAGTVTALDRERGRRLWQVRVGGKVESSPVVVNGLVYFGSHDKRFFAVNAKTGAIRWAYRTGGKINASPSVFRGKACVTTYAGSFVCVNARTGRHIWTKYLKRDAFRYESFYASPSTNGERIFSVARSGKVVALEADTGDVAWTADVGGYGYTTPAVSKGRVFAGGFDGRLRAFSTADGDQLWSAWVPGRILGAPVVIGEHVFFATLEGRTYAARVATGKIVWRLPVGKYSPVIATERTYYFTLNGKVMASRGRKVRETSEKAASEKGLPANARPQIPIGVR